MYHATPSSGRIVRHGNPDSQREGHARCTRQSRGNGPRPKGLQPEFGRQAKGAGVLSLFQHKSTRLPFRHPRESAWEGGLAVSSSVALPGLAELPTRLEVGLRPGATSQAGERIVRPEEKKKRNTSKGGKKVGELKPLKKGNSYRRERRTYI